MRTTTNNIFHTSLACHPSSHTATTSMRGRGRDVGSKCYSITGSRYGTRGMEASLWVVASTMLWRVPLGGNA
jgi:hypothetical protein